MLWIMRGVCACLKGWWNTRTETSTEQGLWEYHNVNLNRVPTYGFGIAVNGGKDSPQAASGDSAIAVSDVLKAGPAEGKLQVEDRLVSANGISLENVDYTRAVHVLRECGNNVTLVIKRKAAHVSSPPHSTSSLNSQVKVTLTKCKKKDDFGVVLGCRIYVKEIIHHSGVEKEGNLQEGDLVLKINSLNTEGMSLKEARKLIENTKEKLHLVLKRDSLVVSNGDSKGISSAPDRIEEKNNVTRFQSGRNRGPITDISLSQLDQPATPLLTGHPHQRPSTPPLPRIDEFTPRREAYDDDPLSRRKQTIQSEARFISFQKEGSVGIRLTGGNEVGVFVTAVQPGSPASLQGLQPGDKLLKVNEMEMSGVTREEAVLFLLHIQDYVHLIVQHMKEEYDEIVANQKGDSFYIRTHFTSEGGSGGEMNFHAGEVFHVVNTLHNGVVGQWLVYRLGRTNQEVQKGVIPNATRAEQLSSEQQASARAAESSRGSFFKRRSARRSKSLSKDHWEDLLFADGISKFPAYERVTLKHPGFIRPIVLFGSLADVARDKLLKDYPDKYASPQMDGHLDDVPKSQKSSGIVRLSAIQEIIAKGKHAILDITPGAVDRLNYAQFHPIVILMRSENKQTVKELRQRLAKSSHKSAKKLHDHAVKLEKLWAHVFTATITLTSADMWYKKLRETIDKQQQQAIWISHAKPESISDDFLFPMTSRLSYASSPESDVDVAAADERHLVKASSDPSIAEQQPPIPSYRQIPYDFLQQQPDSLPPVRESVSPIKYNPAVSGNEGGPLKAPPPRVDRTSKPTHYRTAQERLLARHSLLIDGPPDYINTAPQPHSLDRPNGRLGGFDSSSYSSDSYTQFRSPPPHDPYRYATRNAIPPPPTNKYRHPDDRPAPPSPPPKPNNYHQKLSDGRPIPPPKPGYPPYQNPPPPSRGPWREEELSPPPYSRSSLAYCAPPNRLRPPDSSLERGGWTQPYHNVPPRRPPPYDHHAPLPIDLVNREKRGSAFELYKKPTNAQPC